MRYYLNLFMILTLTACKSGHGLLGKRPDAITSTSKGSSADSQDREDDEDSVTIPVNISGTYLSCGTDKPATQADPSARMACGLFVEESNELADLDQYLQFPWFQLENTGELKVSRQNLIGNTSWHVVFILEHPDFNLVNTTLASTMLVLKGVQVGGDELEVEIKRPVPEILIPEDADRPNPDGLYTSLAGFAFAIPNLDGTTQRACVAFSPQQLDLGRYLASENVCVYAFDTEVSTASRERFLFISDHRDYGWQIGIDGLIPEGAVALGRESNGNIQYLCKAEVIDEGIYLGKISEGYDGCNIATISGYQQINTYQVLVK